MLHAVFIVAIFLIVAAAAAASAIRYCFARTDDHTIQLTLQQILAGLTSTMSSPVSDTPFCE